MQTTFFTIVIRKILKHIQENFGYVSRINPGNIKDREENYMSLLQSLSDFGLKGFPDPKTMTNFGCKGSLVKNLLIQIWFTVTLVPIIIKKISEGLAMTLSYGEKCQKNRGSVGEAFGVFRSLAITTLEDAIL